MGFDKVRMLWAWAKYENPLNQSREGAPLNGLSKDDVLVLISLLLNVANLLRNLLQCVLVVRICCL